MGRSGCSRSWLPLAPFVWALSSLLMQCVPDPRNGTRMGGHGQEGCTTLPSLFSLQHLWPVAQQWVPLPPQASWSRPKSFISVGLAVLGLGRTASLFINPINALSPKSLSFDVSDTTTLTCTNVLQNDSWSPQLAMPCCAFSSQLRQCSARLSLGIPRRGKKESLVPQTAGCSPVSCVASSTGLALRTSAGV